METQHTNLLPQFTAPEAKVLIVDDTPTDIRIARELLIPCGVKVYISRSGTEAIEMVQKERYDLVFMDQMMPGMGGMEVISRIRDLSADDGYFRNLPIVALTASTLDGLEEIFAEMGANGFITKPIDQAKLFDIIEKLLPAEKVIRA